MEDLLPVRDEDLHVCTEPNRRSTHAEIGFFVLVSRGPAGVRACGTGFLARTLLIRFFAKNRPTLDPYVYGLTNALWKTYTTCN